MGHKACCVHSERVDGLSAAGHLEEHGIFYSAVDVYTRLGCTATWLHRDLGEETKHGLSDGAQVYGLHPLRPVTVAGFSSAPNEGLSPCYKYLAHPGPLPSTSLPFIQAAHRVPAMTMQEDCSPACLLSNNAKWANSIKEEDPEFFRNRCTDSDSPVTAALKPPVLYIGCSDWRVPESAVSAMLPNGIFVHRNIANQFHPKDDSALSVLTYAVKELGVSQLIVAGHTDCGGVKAAHDIAHPPCSGCEPPPEPLPRWLAPLTEIARAPEFGGGYTALMQANVRAQVANVAKTDVVRAAWVAGKVLQVHGWIYDLETGRFQDMHISVDGPCEAHA